MAVRLVISSLAVYGKLVTRAVPAAVPLLRHSSGPLVPSSAWKYNWPPITTSLAGDELPIGLMSTTRTVPSVVPTVDHSSTPDVPSVAAKYNRFPYAVRDVG